MDTRAIVLAAITKVAPDVDPSSLPTDVDFREEADLDSMDFIGILTAVHEATGIEVPEIDYPLITTVDAFAAYLDGRV
ncbi:MAG TPA: phosphopantetheine-binding protein [Ilumatobacter sp.]|nr:phosphopantetheine-binding protein [Ilumatobacter sp.]